MKLDRIYTRSGDDGRTSLGDGARLPKFHVRVAAYGSVDEANSIIGIALLDVSDADIRDVLSRVQNDLFDLGGDLCRPEREHRKVEPLRVSERQVMWIEERIDAFNAALTPLDSFVLPGGSYAAAHLHHARTVVRRAERYMTEIAYQEPVNPAALKYANRLSDLLFVLARYVNERGRADIVWRPGLASLGADGFAELIEFTSSPRVPPSERSRCCTRPLRPDDLGGRCRCGPDGSRRRWPPVAMGRTTPKRPCCAQQRNERVSHDPRKVSGVVSVALAVRAARIAGCRNGQTQSR
jgi:cob(I)alamin adenosyltransferase